MVLGFTVALADQLCHGNHSHMDEDISDDSIAKFPCLIPAYGFIVTSGLVPGLVSMAASSSMTTEQDFPAFVIAEGKKGNVLQNFVKKVPHLVEHGPVYKISRELAQIPRKMNEISKLSAAMKQLRMHLTYYDMQGQKPMVSGEFLEIPEWVNYWIRSGVSPLILLAVIVYPQRKKDATLSDPNFYYAAMDGLRKYGRRQLGKGQL